MATIYQFPVRPQPATPSPERTALLVKLYEAMVAEHGLPALLRLAAEYDCYAEIVEAYESSLPRLVTA